MVIGITGGIGSGKSVACNIIVELGGKVIDCDSINDRLLKDDEYINKISGIFSGIVVKNTINKEKLAKMVFYDKELLEKLNSIAHPLIYKMLKKDIALALKDDEVVFVEVPLLFECNLQNLFDEIWIVKSNKQIKTQRIIKRDKKGLKDIEKIMDNQFSYNRIAISENDEENEKCYLTKNSTLALNKKTFNKTKIIINNTSIEDFDRKVKKQFLKLYESISFTK